MKTLSWYAILSGVVLAVLTFVAPIWLRWQAMDFLSQYDAQQFLPDLMEAAKEELRAPYILTRVHSCLSVVAGVLMLKRQSAGWVLWAVLCVLPILASVFDIVRDIAVTAAFLRATWWSIVLWLSWTAVQNRSEAYWRKATS